MKRQYMYGYVFMIERGITKNIYIIWEKSVCVFINMIYIFLFKKENITMHMHILHFVNHKII